MVKLKVFGQLIDIINANEITMNSNSLKELKNELIESYPKIKNHSYQFSVNHEIIFDDITLKESDEIAILPPFAGG